MWCRLSTLRTSHREIQRRKNFYIENNLAKLDLLLVKYNIKLEGKLAFAFKILQKERVVYYLQFFSLHKKIKFTNKSVYFKNIVC